MPSRIALIAPARPALVIYLRSNQFCVRVSVACPIGRNAD
jgi:hypothetical protein